MRIYKITFIIFCFLSIQHTFTQHTQWTLQDKNIFYRYMQNIRLQKPENQLRYTILYFLNTPYAHHTLEINDNEQLVINLHELDCVTYIENVLALLLTFHNQDTSFSAFEKNIQLLRYRDGKIDGYLSRLHYFSDWIKDNEQKGILKNMTYQLNAIPYLLNVFSMSSDKHSILLKKYPQFVDSMKIWERKLNQQSYFYIPKQEVKKHISQIRTGDIIGMTTNLKGLDIAHVGIALWKGDTVYIVHASSTQKKVVENVFLNYLLTVKHFTGIVVIRKI